MTSAADQAAPVLRPTGVAPSRRSPRQIFRVAPALLLAAGAAIALPSAQAAGDVTAGRQKALQCQACHGLDGEAKLPEAPNLAGQNEVYLVKALQDYRGGARRNDMMSVIARGLTDQDIVNLAAYYAAIPVTVGSPPK
jgi:cytochrome c553